MHRSVRSINPSQEEELSNIDAQLDHVNKVLKWSISDLDKFISAMKARLHAEETYVSAMIRITKHNSMSGPDNTTNSNSSTTNEHNYFGDYSTSFAQTTSRYETSIERTIELKEKFITCLKTQIDNLLKLKDMQEQKRKKVKAVLQEKNMNYINFRTKDIVKLHRSYFNKCVEYANLQQQILIGNHEDHHNNNQSNNNSNSNTLDPHHFSPTVARISSDEARLSFDSARGDMDGHSIASQENSTSPPINKKSSMSGFITQMRSQLANAAAAGDPSKQTARLAKLKKEIHDTDQEYRQGIRTLEFLRKKQAETAIHAMRHVDSILLGKSNAVKAVLTTLSEKEEDTLSKEIDLVRQNMESINKMDVKKDTDQFLDEYEKLGFVKPKPIYYENYYYGPCKEILFGSNLNEYYMEHNRTVPLLVTKCINQVELLGGLEKEGIYRISGRQTSVDQLKSEFEKNEEAVDLESKYDVFSIASVLKVYLRELRQPIFNLSMADRMEYSKIMDEEKRKNILSSKLAELSAPQRDTLQAVITHLAKVEKCSQINKMTMKNLSVMFTPALFHDHNQAENAGEWYADKVLEDLILQHETLFINAENKSRLIEQRKINDSPSSSVYSLPFSAGGIVRKMSMNRRPKKPLPTTSTTSTAATTPIPNTAITTTTNNISTNIPTSNSNNNNITKS